MKITEQKEIKTIAVFRALKLGDLMCATPAFRALRLAFPKAHISFIGLPWAKAFAERYSHIFNEFIEFPGYPGLIEQEVHPEKTLHFLGEMQKRGFDLLLQMHGSGTIINPVIAMCHPKLFAGYYPPTLSQLCLNKDTFFPYPEHEHEIRRNLLLLVSLGIPITSETMEFPLFKEDKINYQKIAEREQMRKPFIVIHSGGISAKRYPLEKFAKVANSLRRQGYAIVLTGSEGERTLTERLTSLIKGDVINLAGKTDLGTLGVLLHEAELLLSNDTGVAHIAVALDTPSVTIFTSADPKFWAPLDQKKHKIMLEKDADSTSVINIAFSLLKSTSRERSVFL